ncbi:hypothetical protein WJX82_007993 [Trebouxia sp. C0006]
MDDLDDLLDCEQDLLDESFADQGPPSKRQRADVGIEEFDDEELLALATTQMQEPAGHKSFAASAAMRSAIVQTGKVDRSTLSTHFNSTQEALDEEQEIAELVRLANSTVPQSDNAAGQPSMDEMPESSTAAADRMQEAGTSYSVSVDGPSWSGANITGEYMSITVADGRRAFCRLHAKQDRRPVLQRQHRQGMLLSVPIGSLMQHVEQEAFAKALHDSEVMRTSPAASGAASTIPSIAHPVTAEHMLHQQTLWVDKYSPKSFFELLSDEQINRDVVKWVKSWDARVHWKQAAPCSTMATQQQQGPEQKLLLLSGPPGLGKTTIAHVVARHCGYRPLEINSSDDRTATALQSRIQDAVQMQSVLGKRQMNLVIVDEVDGIAGGSEGRSAVQVLLKLIQASGGKDGNQQDDEQQTADGKGQMLGVKKKSKKAAQQLCRPIIAVCNDMYAPALRPLRGVAKIVQFRKPSVERLLQRLRSICEAEKLVIDRAALTRLCEQTECDVRSCLNTLQFLARKGRPIKVADLNGLSIGQKDISQGAFSIWQDLTQIKRSAALQQDSLLSTLQAFGDNQLVISGPERVMLQWPKVHPQQVRRHTAQTSLVKGWLEDLAPPMFCTLNLRIAVQEILPALLGVVNQPLRPVAQHLFTPQEKTTLALVVATLVAYALTFDLGQQGLTAGQDVAGPAASALTPMAPAVHSLCAFPGVASERKLMPLALCQIVAHEVKLENIRSRNQARPGSAGVSTDGPGTSGSQGRANAEAGPSTQAAAASAKLQYTVAQRMKEAGTGKVTRVKKGTWLDQTKVRQELGRKPLSAHQQRQMAYTAAGGGTLRLPTRYKFHEGYTNAVKRPILMQDLLRCN